MKILSTSHNKSEMKAPKLTALRRSANSGHFVIGADAPPLSDKAKAQLIHKRPSKRAAKLAATVSKANVLCTAVA